MKRKTITGILNGLTTTRLVKKRIVKRRKSRNYFCFCSQCGCEIRGKMAWTGACYKCRKDAERYSSQDNKKNYKVKEDEE